MPLFCVAPAPILCTTVLFQVNWIQCDACNRWFHFCCAGLKTNNVSPKTSFICSFCQEKKVSTCLFLMSVPEGKNYAS